MDLQSCKKIIVFGGSFDPPHIGHVKLPTIVRDTVGADTVVYIPSGNHPFKEHTRQTPAHHRLAMLRLALHDVPHAVILTDEIDRAATSQSPNTPPNANAPTDRPTYTVDTLERLRKRVGPQAEMRLLIGGDQLKVFDTWHQPRRIIELAQPLVMVRPPDTRDSLLASLPTGYDPQAWAPRLIDLPPVDITSTQIRRLVAQGQPIATWVCPPVEDYIHRHGLYRA